MSTPNEVYCYLVDYPGNSDPNNFSEPYTEFFKTKDLVPESMRGYMFELHKTPPHTAVRIPPRAEETDIPHATEDYKNGWNDCRSALVCGMQMDAEARARPETAKPRDRIHLRFFLDNSGKHHHILANDKLIGFIRYNAQAALPYGLDIVGFYFRKIDGRWQCTCHSHGTRGRIFFETLNDAKTATGAALQDILREQLKALQIKSEE